MHAQDLTDRLVIATQEQDVLYVLHWLEEMREENCLEEAINNKHSWKGCSALGSIIKTPFTQLRRLILEILLLGGADVRSRDVIELAMQERNLDVLKILLTWEKSEKDEANDAKYLLSLIPEEAADWIDKNLPPPPNPDFLTGCNDPSPNPSSLSTSAIEQVGERAYQRSQTISDSPILDQLERSPKQDVPSTCLDSPPTRPSSSQLMLQFVPTESPGHKQVSQSPAHLPAKSNALALSPSPHRPRVPPSLVSHYLPPLRASPVSSTSQSSMDRLTIGNLPLGFRPIDVQELFTVIGVDSRVLICHTSFTPTYAYVDVAQSQTALCTKLLDNKKVQSYTIWCQIARSTEKGKRSRKRPRLDPDNYPLPRPPSPSDPALQPSPSPPSTNRSSYNLLLLNLPLDSSLEVLALLENLPSHELHRLKDQDQSAVFIYVETLDSANHLINLWHNFAVDGRRLQATYAKEGLKGMEAIRDHFGGTKDSRRKSAHTSTSNPRKKPPRTSTVSSTKLKEVPDWDQREEEWKRAQGGRTGGQWGEWDLV
ncbi:hypothetical protein JCM5353_007500 [Sporobolomyces roseus]